MSHNFQEVIDELHRGRELLTSTSGTQGILSRLSEVISDVSSQLSKYCSDDAWIATINLKTAQYIIGNIRGCISGYSDANEQLIIAMIGSPKATSLVRSIGYAAVESAIFQAAIDSLHEWLASKQEEVNRIISEKGGTGDEYYINVASKFRTDHVIKHHLGTGEHEGKPFPKNWSIDRIMHNVSLIIADPTTKWLPNYPKPKDQEEMDAAGIVPNFRWMTIKFRDGINILVSIEPRGEGVITSHPVNKVPAHLRDLL